MHIILPFIYSSIIYIVERQIFVTRHGESEDNITGRIGGDAPVSCLLNVVVYNSIL